MDNSTKRRNFLKSISIMSAAVVSEPLANRLPGIKASTPHVIILILDAWSARNVGLYGYARDTMPNLTKFAEKAIVYKNHYSNANYTIPGTSSLLTGTHPWTHRAFNLGSLVKPELTDKQIFEFMSGSYQTLGYAQNVYPDQLLGQFQKSLNIHIPFSKYNLNDIVVYDEKVFEKDTYSAFAAFEDNIFARNDSTPGSLFFGTAKKIVDKRDQKTTLDAIPDIYEDGPPKSLEYFLISDLVDGLISQIKAFTQPSFMYFHVFPPHGPYKAYKHHYQRFLKDKYLPIEKPVHPLIDNIKNQEDMNADRMSYDALIASLDEELGRFFTYFEDSGMKEKTHLFITSDHGEMFERGHVGHWDKMLYEPVLHVPLIVSTPGITARVDVTEKTNNIDLFPTIAHLTNNPTPPWAEGEILPELGGSRNADRSIFTMDVSNNPIRQAIREYSFSLHRGKYKMIKYNYSAYQGTEFYDLAADPEEMNDLYSTKPATAIEMERQLDEKMAEINAPYLMK